MEPSKLLLGPKSVERLQKIKKHIQEEPRRFFMEHFLVHESEKEAIKNGADPGYFSLPKWYSEPPCGTTACIAGWANLLSVEAGEARVGYDGADDTMNAIAWLDISSPPDRPVGQLNGYPQSLFNYRTWPFVFLMAYKEAQTAEEAVQAAADYIDWLCAGPKRKEATA